jgi:Sec-independent protein translocase protein TatA
MILLSPPKVLMILAIALIVLGPDKLPSAARRVGALWSEFTRWRAHLESEVRSAFPDLPSTTDMARAVRSPITLLDRLADEHGATPGAGAGNAAGGETPGSTTREPVPAAGHGRSAPGGAGAPPPVSSEARSPSAAASTADHDVSLMN